MASADFSGESPRPHGISHTSFIVYSPDLRIRGYGCLWELRCLRPACPPGTRLRIRFLFVEPRFRYCFLSPGSYPRLANRYGVRRQLRPQWTFTTDVGHARHTEKGSAAAGAWRPLIPLVDAMFLISVDRQKAQVRVLLISVGRQKAPRVSF